MKAQAKERVSKFVCPPYLLPSSLLQLLSISTSLLPQITPSLLIIPIIPLISLQKPPPYCNFCFLDVICNLYCTLLCEQQAADCCPPGNSSFLSLVLVERAS